MDSSSSPIISPPRHASQGSLPENRPSQGRVPRQQVVTSASPLPGSPSRLSVASHVASAKYVQQFQAFIEHQRQTFDQERALWNTERMELHEKIAQLDGSLRRYQAVSSSQLSSPTNTSINLPQTDSSSQSLLSKDGSSPTSATTTGHEFWRGPQPASQPTRTFSEPTIQPTKPRDQSRLPSIAEDTTCGRKDSSNMQHDSRKQSLSGRVMEQNIDGITFKSNPLSAVPANKIMTPQSPSPRTSTPSLISPQKIHLPLSTLEAPLDPYTKDAGHTPLARRAYVQGDGASSEGDGTTPTQPEIDRPPLEPHASFTKLPSERSNSYFPTVEGESRDKKDIPVDQEEDGKDKSPDEDPELKGPLGLDNSSTRQNNRFLHELDSRLEGLVAQKDNEDFEQPEEEPKLRIKRSMNFGSAFGAKTSGKGI